MKGQDTYILLFCSLLPSPIPGHFLWHLLCKQRAKEEKVVGCLRHQLGHSPRNEYYQKTTRSSNSDWVLLPSLDLLRLLFLPGPARPSLCNFNESGALRLNLKQLWSPKTVQMATENTICRAAPAPVFVPDSAPAAGKWAGIRAWEVLSRQQAFECPVVAP